MNRLAEPERFCLHCGVSGSERPQDNRFRIVEVNPKSGGIDWSNEAQDSNSFSIYRQGAVQNHSNGNALATSSHHGHLVEAAQDKKVVWVHVSPVASAESLCLIGWIATTCPATGTC